MRYLNAILVASGALALLSPRAVASTIFTIARGNENLRAIDEQTHAITTIATGFSDALDVKLLPNGNLIVTDNAAHALKTFDRNGNPLATNSLAFNPADLLVEADGTIYSTSVNRVSVGTAAGAFSLYSSVPGDLSGIVQRGSFLYTVSAAGGLYKIDMTNGNAATNYSLIRSFPGELRGLALFGSDLLVTDYGSGQIDRVSGLDSGPVTSTLFATLSLAGGIIQAGGGGFFVTQQTTPGAVYALDTSGNLTALYGPNAGFGSPRGLAELYVPAPEPATLCLLGLAGALGARRRSPRPR